MNEALLLHILANELALPRQFSTEVVRPWGHLFYNLENTSHMDANKGRMIRTTDPDQVVAEVTAFYQGHGLTPRVTLDSLTEPVALAHRFQAQGYAVESGGLPVMTWEGPAPADLPLPPGVTIERATLADVSLIGQIRGEAWGYQPGWLTQMAAREMVSPAYHYFIARVEGEPAACGALVDYGDPARLEYVATRPAFRGRGLAQALVRRIQQFGRPLYLLYTREDARRVYERAGFVPAGELVETDCSLE